MFDPDYEFDARDVAPNMGIVRGVEAVTKLCDEYWDTFEDFHIEFKEVLHADEEHVVTAVKDGGRMKGSDAEIWNRLFHVWTFRDGKVLRISSRTDREPSLQSRRAGGVGVAIVEATRELEPQEARPIGWDGKRLDEMLAESERLFAESGSYYGLDGELELKDSDPIGYEKLFARLRGGLVSARETALNISASPIVRELGELCFALYTPEGDSIALSTGIIVHVHTMSDAIKFMVRNGWEDNPKIRPGDIFANDDPVIGDVHNADVQTFVPIFWEGELVAWAGGVTHVLDIGASTPGGVPVGPTNRLDDGIDLPCMKIGEDDELAQWHLLRCQKRNSGADVLPARRAHQAGRAATWSARRWSG